LIILFWAGYNAVNRFKLNQDNALRTGLITGFIASWIIVPISLIVLNSGWVKGASPVSGSMLDYLLYILMVSFTMAVKGAIIAAIGGYIALRGKPKEEPTAKKKPKQS
jgi:drug/metabolite transporter (DMT)-like permease